MPTRLRPTAPMAQDAILVGDPGRALLLAQELLEQPKMSNHARGLWGYSGDTHAGRALTIQATGMGGPSAAIVLADLAELGVRRVVRVGTCVVFDPDVEPGELLLIEAALATAGSAASFGLAAGEMASPDPALKERLAAELGAGVRAVTVASLDKMPTDAAEAGGAPAADMQTLALLACGPTLDVAAAAVLIGTEVEARGGIGDEGLERAVVEAGTAAAKALSNPQVES